MKHFNKMKPHELEIMALMAGEAAEVVKDIGKTIQHGWDSCDPTKGDSPTNRELIAREVGDLIGVVNYAVNKGWLDMRVIKKYAETKMGKAAKYLHHQDEK